MKLIADTGEALEFDKIFGAYIKNKECNDEEVVVNVVSAGDFSLAELFMIRESFMEGLRTYTDLLLEKAEEEMTLEEVLDFASTIADGDMNAILEKFKNIK